MNAGSKVSYKQDDFTDRRLLELEGEGNFTVKRGQGFIVKTKQGNIGVLGTTFNVYSRPDGFEVTCFIGKVRVQRGKETIDLVRNEKVVWKNGKLEKVIDYASNPDWVEGESIFDDAPFDQVTGELERQFGIKIDLKLKSKPENYPYRGSFPNDDLQQAMDNIVGPYNLRYEQTGRIMKIWEE